MADAQQSNMRVSQYWMGASIALLVAAACCWWLSLIDAAFVTATLGVVAWFLSLRNRLRLAHIETGEAGGNDRQAPPDKQDTTREHNEI